MSGHREYEVKTTINKCPEDTEHSQSFEYHLVIKRYSDFEALYTKLMATYLEYLIPPLPDKSIKNFLATDESEFVSQRIKDLEYFLVRINSHPKLRSKPEFREFLTYKREEGKRKSLSLDYGHKYVKAKFEKLQSNKIYKLSANIWNGWSVNDKEALHLLPVHQNTEREYQEDFVKVAK
jgi:hypothetical protein